MAGDFLSIEIPELPALKKKFNRLHSLYLDEGADEANKYIVRVMKLYEPYRYVPFQFVSEKQRRYVMARISEGTITPGSPHRMQKLAGGWKIIGSGIEGFVANEVPYAPYVQGNRSQQSRHMKAVGWKGIDIRMKERAGEVARRFGIGVQKAIRILGLA